MRALALLLAALALAVWLLWPEPAARARDESPHERADPATSSPPPTPGSGALERSAARPPAAAANSAGPSGDAAASASGGILVRVVDEDGAAAPRARVDAHEDSEGWLPLGVTGADGTLRVPWELRRAWLDAVRGAERGGAASAHLADGSELLIRLRRQAEIAGHAYAPDGRPLADVVVEFLPLGARRGPSPAIRVAEGEEESPHSLTLTDAAGAFRVLVEPGAEVDLMAYSSRHGWILPQLQRARAGADDVRLDLLAAYAVQIVVRARSPSGSSFDLEPWMLEQGRLALQADFDEPVTLLKRGAPLVDRLLFGEHLRSQHYVFADELILACARESDAYGPLRVTGAGLGVAPFTEQVSLPRLRYVPAVHTIEALDAAAGRCAVFAQFLHGSAVGAELTISADGPALWRLPIREHHRAAGGLVLPYFPSGTWHVRVLWPAWDVALPLDGGQLEWIVGPTEGLRTTLDFSPFGEVLLEASDANGDAWRGALRVELRSLLRAGAEPKRATLAHAPHRLTGLPPGRWELRAARDASDPAFGQPVEVEVRTGVEGLVRVRLAP